MEQMSIQTLQPNSMRKFKEERVYVKSNKGTKIELKNLDQIFQIEESGELDMWTQNEMFKIKNTTFKNNIFDVEIKQIVSSIRLVKTSKLGRKLTPMVWEYYKNRGNLDVNQIIKQYSRDNLIINYSISPQSKKKNIIIDDNITNIDDNITNIDDNITNIDDKHNQ